LVTFGFRVIYQTLMPLRAPFNPYNLVFRISCQIKVLPKST
jgi:hypothetical protein